MNTKSGKKNNGFTLIELLVALSISVLIILMTGLVFTQSVRHTRVIVADANVISGAAHLTAIFSYYIRPAVSIDSADSTQLEITTIDLSTHTFEFVDDELRLDGTSILPTNVSPTDVTFTIVDRTVRISYELVANTSSLPGYENVPFSGTITLALRN